MRNRAQDNDGLSGVNAPVSDGKVVYQTELSPNALYKKYRKWYFEKHGNSFDGVMPFKEWIKWAKARGVVSADGEVGEAEGEPREMRYEQAPTEVAKEATKGIDGGKIIAGALVLAAIVGIVMAVTKPKAA